MRNAVIMFIAAALTCGCCGSSLPRDRHFDSSRFALATTDCNVVSGGSDEMHSLIVIKDGKVVYEYYDPVHSPKTKHILWSASKTFTATAIGFAVQDGLLSVDDKVVSFFDEELPDVISDTLASLSIKHLLTMSSGIRHDYIGETEALYLENPAQKTLGTPFKFVPGERFSYNSMNTYLLSAIITKVTGKTCAEYLDGKFFKPLGIRDYYWKESAEGYNMGGWGLYLRPEDFAKSGLFYLQKGVWNGKSLLDEEWFDEAMYPYHNNGAPADDWGNGYGYQMWRSSNGSWRFDGAWGQVCAVCPEKNAVICWNGLFWNNREVYKSIWKHIYDNL